MGRTLPPDARRLGVDFPLELLNLYGPLGLGWVMYIWEKLRSDKREKFQRDDAAQASARIAKMTEALASVREVLTVLAERVK